MLINLTKFMAFVLRKNHTCKIDKLKPEIDGHNVNWPGY